MTTMATDSIYSALIDLVNSIFNDTSVVRRFQNKPMTKDIIEGGILTDIYIEAIDHIGSDYTFFDGLEFVSRGDREVHISMEQFNGGSLDRMNKLKHSFRLFSTQEFLLASGLAFISADSPTQTTRLWHNNFYVDSAMLQCRFRLYSDYSEQYDIIETGDIVGTVQNKTLDINYDGGSL